MYHRSNKLNKIKGSKPTPKTIPHKITNPDSPLADLIQWQHKQSITSIIPSIGRPRQKHSAQNPPISVVLT